MKHWLWEDKPFKQGQAWVDLLMLANYTDKKKPKNGEIITYKRGSVNISMTQLADRWGWDRRTVKRFLDLLSNDGMVSTECTTHGTTITIVNYEVFNNPCTTNGTTNAQQDVQQMPTTNKDNKEQEREEKKDTHLAERKQIIEYLNQKCGTKYRHGSDINKKHINARLNEGYAVEDFFKVIDKKYDEWNGTEQEKYLRPETLFGNKFESYLNQKINKEKPKNKFNDFPQREYDFDELEKQLLGK